MTKPIRSSRREIPTPAQLEAVAKGTVLVDANEAASAASQEVSGLASLAPTAPVEPPKPAVAPPAPPLEEEGKVQFPLRLPVSMMTKLRKMSAHLPDSINDLIVRGVEREIEANFAQTEILIKVMSDLGLKRD